ncbi:uncharacterized protein [Rutidosis leptorrhynchoides]|uniref:uncharacterized protein n=1 Tax=Rutidosis leptorrhynchoides TaxID=125765 RepID=UPI003A99B173
MEGLTTKVYDGVKCYSRTRGYDRLATTTNATSTGLGECEEVFGGTMRQMSRRKIRRRLLRFRINPRLKIKLGGSPRKLFLGLRDAYVKIMMKLANTSIVRGRTMTGFSGDGFGKTTVKEYDEKMIIEIYKALAINRNHQLHDQIPSQFVFSA